MPGDVLLAAKWFNFLGAPAGAPASFGPGPQPLDPNILGVANYDNTRLADKSIVPHGPTAWVRAQALELVKQHDSRIHALISFVNDHRGAKTDPYRHCRLQTATHMLRWSCNDLASVTRHTCTISCWPPSSGSGARPYISCWHNTRV